MIQRTDEITDELIDATLLALNHNQPRSGLEARILQSLDEAQQRTAHVSHARQGWTTPLFSLGLWIPTSLAAAVLAIVFAIYLHHTSASTQTSTTAAVEAYTKTATHHERVVLSAAQPSRRVAKLSTDLIRPNLSISTPGVATPAPTPYDQAALDDTLAPSHPAPPLPLTKQERLLLRCTRHSQPIEVAELDLAHRQEFQPVAVPRDASSLQEYVKNLLHTLVRFQPSEPVPPTDDTPSSSDQSAPVQQPISSH